MVLPYAEAGDFVRWRAEDTVEGSPKRRIWPGAARIVLIYAGFATLWILISDRVAGLLFSNPATLVLVAMAKGVFFVLVTSLMLYVLIAGHVRETRAIKTSLSRSEENLSSYIATAPLAVFVFDAQGKCVEMNAAGRRMPNIPWNLHRSSEFADLLPHAYHERAAEDFASLMKDGHWEGDIDLGRAVGPSKWVHARGVKLSDSRSVVFCQDMTDQWKAGLEVRQSEHRFRSLFENMLEGFAYCRMLTDDAGVPIDFIYLDVNAAFERLTGLTSVVGKRVSDLIPDIARDEPTLIARYGRVATGAPPERFEEYLPALGIWLDVAAYSIETGYFIAVFDNITDRKVAEQNGEATLDLLRICNKATAQEQLIHELTVYFKNLTTCDAVGVRLQNNGDYPYYETRGFDDEFVQLENSLCVRLEDGAVLLGSDGRPFLECMCGNVIRGRVDHSQPFFTENGSFWSSGTTQMLASTTDSERQTHTRNRCNSAGFESVALIPLQTQGETFGLVQFNDRRVGKFTKASIATLETLVSYVAIALAKIRTDEALREASQFSQQVIASADEGIVVYGTDARFRSWNPFMERLTGFTSSQVIGHHPDEIFPFLRQVGVVEQIEKALQGEATHPVDFHYDIPHKGKSGWASDVEAPLRNTRGDIIGVISTVRDITENMEAAEQLKETNERLLQAEKMEAVGRLAGGVAHDFNNILTAIYGYCDLILERLPESNPERAYAAEIRKAAVRAAALTQQLLAFSRRQTLQPQAVDLNTLARNLHKMLGRLIGEDIELVMDLADSVWSVRVDPARIEQALINLAVNARDAMPHGGTLRIATENVVLGASFVAEHADALAGEHVMISVADDGAGMDELVQSHLFEPFFTTKEVGKGTGLGLSSVYGIVKQSGGIVAVQSAPGKGTTFRLYLPRGEAAAVTLTEPVSIPAPRARSHETILFVEDDPAVRGLMTLVLSEQGYAVMTATDGEDALRVAQPLLASIDLMITDIVMPRMNGRELADRMRKLRPDLKVAFMSGYTNDTVAYQEVVEKGIELIEKPIKPDLLLARVYDILHGKDPEGT